MGSSLDWRTLPFGAATAGRIFLLLAELGRRGPSLGAHMLENAHRGRIGAWKSDENVRVQPFDAIEIELGEFWAR
jgi:hypothetical protein